MKRVLPNISVRRRSDQCDRQIATRFVMADVSLWSSRISLGNRAIHAHPRVTPYTKTKSNRGAQSVEGEGTAVHPKGVCLGFYHSQQPRRASAVPSATTRFVMVLGSCPLLGG